LTLGKDPAVIQKGIKEKFGVNCFVTIENGEPMLNLLASDLIHTFQETAEIYDYLYSQLSNEDKKKADEMGNQLGFISWKDNPDKHKGEFISNCQVIQFFQGL
jgi:hypothetical protein